MTTVRPVFAPRSLLPLLLGCCALALCVMLSLALGSRPVPWSTVLNALFGDGHNREALTVTGLCLPRTMIGLMVGAALGVAGMLAQGITRNPLAPPTTLGINAGAGVAVVIAIYLLHLTRPGQYVWFALAGAAGAALLVQPMARARWIRCGWRWAAR